MYKARELSLYAYLCKWTPLAPPLPFSLIHIFIFFSFSISCLSSLFPFFFFFQFIALSVPLSVISSHCFLISPKPPPRPSFPPFPSPVLFPSFLVAALTVNVSPFTLLPFFYYSSSPSLSLWWYWCRRRRKWRGRSWRGKIIENKEEKEVQQQKKYRKT